MGVTVMTNGFWTRAAAGPAARRLGIGLAAALSIAASAGCGSGDAEGSEGGEAGPAGDAPSTLVPRKCPVTEKDVADIVGRQMKNSPPQMKGVEPCNFNPDPQGDALEFVTLLVSRTIAGANDDKEGIRETNEELGLTLTDLDRGEWGLFGTDDHAASAFVNYGEVYLQVNVTLADADPAELERVTLAVIDAAAD